MNSLTEHTLQTQAKRVFILGAGFSKPAGLPLATELTDDLLGEIRQRVGDDHRLLQFADHIRQLHQWISRKHSIPLLNIEEFYDYATNYAERFRFEQHLQTVGRDAGETAYRQAWDIEAWLSQLDDRLLDVLLRYEQQANLCPIRRFANILRPSDVIVTFNYDLLVERALAAQDRDWTLAFNDVNGGRIKVLKLHGSVDWVCLPRREHYDDSGLELLFSKTDTNQERNPPNSRINEIEYDFELFRTTTDARMESKIQNRKIYQGDQFFGLAGLGPCKRVSQVPGLGVPWELARQAISRAELIIIVGFSFSGFDRLAQIEFARVMAGREERNEPGPRIVVVDPLFEKRHGRMRPGGPALLKRIESVFRPAECAAVGHENYDWGLVD